MVYRHFFIRVFLCVIAAYILGGCAAYDVTVEERNISTYTADKKISYKIEQQFLKDALIKFMDFDAYTYEGHVYLIGEYENERQTDRAVEIAKATKGVRNITTYFLPKSDANHCGPTDNLAISAKLRKELIADGDIWSTNIDVEMVQCNAVLLGLVSSQQEKVKAIRYAQGIPGVRSVKSYLKVR